MIMRLSRLLNATLFLLSALILWWLLSRYYNSPLFPGPASTLFALIDVFSLRESWYHVGVTAYRVFAGVALGSVIGTACGLFPRYSRVAEDIVQSVIHPLFESVPSICWALIFATWFGLSDTTPILIVFVAVTPFFIINVWEGLKEIDESLIEMAMSFTRDRVRILRKVVLPMLYPYLFSAFKIAFEVAWKVVIIGELFGAISGVGYMLNIAYEVFAIERVFAWTVCCAAIIILFDYGIFSYIDRRYMRRWRRAQ